MSIADKIRVLEDELYALKVEEEVKALAVKRSQQWVSVKKTMPDKEMRAIVWSDNQMKAAWFVYGEWYEWDGDWMLKEKDKISDVSHWMGTDWMYSTYWPQYGPGVLNRIRFYWLRFTQGATSMAYDLRPAGWGSKAQLGHKPSFYFNFRTGEIMTGGPEHASAPRGYEKVTCNSALEAERWSGKQRQWDRAKHARIQEERAPIEEAKHAEIRAEMHHRMSNARNNVNREFMRRAIETSDGRPSPWRYERESYLHSEAHEVRNR